MFLHYVLIGVFIASFGVEFLLARKFSYVKNNNISQYFGYFEKIMNNFKILGILELFIIATLLYFKEVDILIQVIFSYLLVFSFGIICINTFELTKEISLLSKGIQNKLLMKNNIENTKSIFKDKYSFIFLNNSLRMQFFYLIAKNFPVKRLTSWVYILDSFFTPKTLKYPLFLFK